MSIGQKIKGLRKGLALNQQELADKIGIDRSNISLWERDLVTPSPHNMKAVAEVLKVDASYFYDDKYLTLLVTVQVILEEFGVWKAEKERISIEDAHKLLQSKIDYKMKNPKL